MSAPFPSYSSNKASNRQFSREPNSSNHAEPASSRPPSRIDSINHPPARSRHSSGSSVQSFGLSAASSQPVLQHHATTSLHSSHRTRALTSGSPRVASPTAGLSSLSQGASNLAGGGGISRLARHSPSLSLSTTGSPVSSTGPTSASGSSGQLTSLVVTQLNILLSTIKDDGDPVKWQAQAERLQKLVDENGMEVFSHYFRRLLVSNAAIVFPASGRTAADNAGANNYQLLVREMQKLVTDPHQADKIAEALDTTDGDLFRDFDLNAFIGHFQIHLIARTALLLACRRGHRLELRNKADAILANTLQPFVHNFSQPHDGSECSPEVIAFIIDQLNQDPPKTWSEDQRLDFYFAIRMRYTRMNSRIPSVVEAAMCLHDILTHAEGRLARHIQRAGPRCTTSLEACRDLLSSVETRDISYHQIANALLFMIIADGGLEYKPAVFVEAVRLHRAGLNIDWTDVVQGFDKEHLRITKQQFLSLYEALLPLAIEYENFDIQSLWGSAWQYPETLLSFVVAFLSTDQKELDVTKIPKLRRAFTVSDFETAADSVKEYAAEAVKHPLVSRDATETLFTMIFRSQETYIHAQNLEIPETLINPHMTIFIVAAAAVPKPWAALQEQALKQLFYPFLCKDHPHYDFVMHALWKTDKHWVAARLVEFYAQDAMLLEKIFEHAREHGWMELLLTIQSSFVVDLATYAHGQHACDLDAWTQTHVDLMGPAAFGRAVADFLQQKMEDEASVQREHAQRKTVRLEIQTVFRLLTMIEDSLPETEWTALQRQCLQLYPRLINYGDDERRDSVIEANDYQKHSLPDNAASQMEEQYKKMYGGGVDANDIIDELKRLKVSEQPEDQDLFAAMIHGLFDEYNCFGEYPNEALATTAVLFGGLVKYDVLTGFSAQVALFMVFEAVVSYSPDDSMWKFGMQALLHFMDRLKHWPHLAERILQIPSLRGTQVIPVAERILSELKQEDPRALNGDMHSITNGDTVDDEFPADAPTPPFASIHADPPLRQDFYEQPNEETSDKVIFVLNNMSKRNLEEKFKELQGALQDRHVQWFAHYLVEELAKSQPNYQSLYLQLLESFDRKLLWSEVLRETYVSCAKMLNAQTTMESTQERTTLKNLAGWLGSLTLARDKPVLHRNLSFKDLLLEAHDTQRLLVAIPFTCKVLIQAASSRVFRPPNPWLMELLGFLSELYHFMELKLNLKFEIEVLCKGLDVDINKVEPLDIIRSRPMLHENNLLPSYLPDGNGDGFGDMHLIGLSKRASSERFSPEAVIQALPDLGNLLQIPQAAGNVTQPQLRTIFINAAQQAIYEIIAPVVERSVTIAAISTAELIQKDFATESDVDKVRNAAHTMVRALSGSLALVTCKEPLRMSTTNNIRILAARHLPDQLPEGQILMFVNDNIETVCSLVERAAEEHSIREADAQLAAAIEQRKQHNDQRVSEPFNQPPVSRWAQLIPEPYRQELGGLNRQQLTLYEDFGRQARITPTSTGLNTTPQDPSRALPDVLGDAYLPGPTESGLQRPGQQRKRSISDQINGYADPANIGQAIRSLLESLQQACRESAEERIADIGETATVRRLFDELVSRIDNSVQKESLALAAAQEALLKVFQDSQKRLEIDVLVRLVEQLCRMSSTTQRHITHWLASFETEQMFNCPVIVALLNEHLLQLEQVDVAVAKALKAHRIPVLVFLKDFINAVLLGVNHIGAFRADFALTYEAIGSWVSEDVELDLGREILQLLQLPSDSTIGLPSPPTSDKHDQLEYVFEEWLRLQQKNAPHRAEIAFVQQLQKQHFAAGSDDMTLFVRTSLDACVAAHERASAMPYRAHEPIHISTDALAKLIALLVAYHEGDNKQREGLFQAILVVVTLTFQDQYNKLRERFPGRVYFRLLSSLLYELHGVRDALGEAGSSMSHKSFADMLMCLQPNLFEGFCFAWLSLLSHRQFLPTLLRSVGRANGGWKLALAFFTALFDFYEKAVNEAEANINVREYYQGIGRIMTMLHRDFPEFLVENHATLNGLIPEDMSQLHNVINSAAAHAVLTEQPDPFERGLKVNRLEQTRQLPTVFTDLNAALSEQGLLAILNKALADPDAEVGAILSPLETGSQRFRATLANYVVLYIGNKATATSTVYSAAASEAKVLDKLVQASRPSSRYLILAAMTNQLRYVNGHTQYFSTALLHTFAVSQEHIQQQIMAILVKRLAVPRPHPWGFIVTVLELIKNQSYDLWSLDWIKAQPQVESMLMTLAQYQDRLPHSPLRAGA